MEGASLAGHFESYHPTPFVEYPTLLPDSPVAIERATSNGLGGVQSAAVATDTPFAAVAPVSQSPPGDPRHVQYIEQYNK